MFPPACEIKRIVEICSSGLYSEEELLRDSAAIWERHRAVCRLEAVREALLFLAGSRFEGPAPLLAPYLRDVEEKLAWRDKIIEEAAPDPLCFRKWRDRQKTRCSLELGEAQGKVITHVPGAFELSSGCSVNCRFCALNAPLLTEIYRATPEHLDLWRRIQIAMKEVLGASARWSTVYWATEPLDNPDHEIFCEEFYGIHGQYPQTTTAVPLRDVGRVKALLTDSSSKGCRVNRFSVRSGEQLRAIHANFSAEELRDTELILLYPGTPTVMIRSGRLFDLRRTDPEMAKREDEKIAAAARRGYIGSGNEPEEISVNASYLDEGCGRNRVNIPNTTTCVSGFLVRLIPQTVELISPCAADETWPLGYMVYDRRSFADARDFKKTLNEMIRGNMPERVTPEDAVTLSGRANFTPLGDGFALSTAFGRVAYRHQSRGSFLARLGEILREGNAQAGEIALECAYAFGQSELTTMSILNDLFSKGLLLTTAEQGGGVYFSAGKGHNE
jgi:radical SAM family RiPP maturation amino acid epimerase